MANFETVWEFKTPRFRVALEIYPEDLDPADSFMEGDESIEQIRNGNVAWFCAVVSVYLDGNRIGCDSLGGCAYASVREFFTSHRDKDPMNRNCTIMHAARGDNVVICHYFPDMISEAVAEARKNIGNTPRMRLA